MKIEISCSELAHAINKHLQDKFQSKVNKGPFVKGIYVEHEYIAENGKWAKDEMQVGEDAIISLILEDRCGKTGLYGGFGK
mgnify:CR=1 FL=1